MAGLRPISNPPNPWLSTEVEYLDEIPDAKLEVYEDHTREILASNDSPDVGFTWSVNPYRGCFHACSYCLLGSTKILMGDGTLRSISGIRPGDEIYGTTFFRDDRRYVRTRVLAHWSTPKRAYRISLANGTELVASGDHRFLTRRGWKHTTNSTGRDRAHLTTNDKLLGTGEFAEPPNESDAYKRGYLCGMIRGDGHVGKQFRLALVDIEPLVRVQRKALMAIGCSGRTNIEDIRSCEALGRFGFDDTVEPAIARKCDIEGRALKSKTDLRVVSIEDTGLTLPMFDITTGTGDFIANGVVSHNCYARPTHEYLGFGAGTDFDRKITVKPDAPRLLREAFERPSWKGEVVVFSGVTDCYQPLEASYRLTRQCLEVCAAYRNPVGIITKAPLVERDLDLLQELTRTASAGVTVSIPIWDREHAHAVEPYVATPERRMKTIERLAAAGIDVGVNIAPVIPGLSDSDIPRILEAAHAAGARRAGFVFLRLPGSVAQVFEERIRAALPLRAGRILNRVREARGGRLYDSRFGHRQRGTGTYAEAAQALFESTVRRLGMNQSCHGGSADTFQRPGRGRQLPLL